LKSIGRAIRHAGDYATVLLLDQRYHTEHLARDWLPGWMAKSLQHAATFGQGVAAMSSFFRARKRTAASSVL
jgi:chromosome transmission fidelity protein 1